MTTPVAPSDFRKIVREQLRSMDGPEKLRALRCLTELLRLTDRDGVTYGAVDVLDVFVKWAMENPTMVAIRRLHVFLDVTIPAYQDTDQARADGFLEVFLEELEDQDHRRRQSSRIALAESSESPRGAHPSGVES